MTRFSMQLKAARQRAGLTQQELAVEMDSSQQAIAKWENSDTLPRAESMRKLALLLQFDPHEAAIPLRPAIEPGLLGTLHIAVSALRAELSSVRLQRDLAESAAHMEAENASHWKARHDQVVAGCKMLRGRTDLSAQLIDDFDALMLLQTELETANLNYLAMLEDRNQWRERARQKDAHEAVRRPEMGTHMATGNSEAGTAGAPLRTTTRSSRQQPDAREDVAAARAQKKSPRLTSKAPPRANS